MVLSFEMRRGYRSGERKVRDPGENGENNKNTFGTPYAILKLFEIWAIYTEFLPSSQTIPALPTASNARSKEKKTFYAVSWIK